MIVCVSAVVHEMTMEKEAFLKAFRLVRPRDPQGSENQLPLLPLVQIPPAITLGAETKERFAPNIPLTYLWTALLLVRDVAKSIQEQRSEPRVPYRLRPQHCLDRGRKSGFARDTVLDRT